jgi:hypothetical protein
MKRQSVTVYTGLTGPVVAIPKITGLRVYYPGSASLTRLSRLANQLVNCGIVTIYPATAPGLVGWVMERNEVREA